MHDGDRRGATRAVLLAVGCLALVLSGCATIPTGGPVRQGHDLAQEPDLRPPRSVGREPGRGDGPEAIVRGFLQSGADFLDDHFYAREYLAPSVRPRWDPSKSTTIYDRAVGFSVDVVAAGEVVVTAEEVARIDGDGSYHRVAAADPVQRHFSLGRVRGAWRITSLDPGLLLSTSDINSAYRQFNLYFVAPTSNTVVPDPVLLPDLPGLTTKLVTRLLQGPTAALRGAVETAFPQGTRLEVGAVPVRDGLATIRLDRNALQGSDADARVRMSAQIVWTLRQLPEVLRVRILADGDDLVTSGVAREQPRTAWSGFDPDIIGSSASLYAVRGDQVGQLVDGTFVPALGGAGQHAGYRRPAVSLDGTRIAVTSTTHTALLVGRLVAGASLEAVAVPSGADVSAPSWDNSGDLWFVDRRTGRLYLDKREEDRVVEVRLPKLAAGGLQIVRVARDGTRIALAAGTGAGARFYVGAIVRNASGEVQEIDAVHEVLPDLRGVRDLAWIDADTLVVLGSRGDEPLVALQTDSDGLAVDAGIEPQRGLVSVAAAPVASKLPLVAATDAGQLQQWDPSLGWLPLGAGRDPAYPG